MADQYPTPQNFYDAEKDLRTVDAVSNSKDPDTDAEINTWLTRRGGQSDTLAGRLKALGIERIGDFTAGCTVTKRNQGVLEVGGSLYVWLGAFPVGGKIVPPSSTPASTGGIGPAGWLDVGDASAYSRVLAALAAPNGVDLVTGAAKQTDLTAATSRIAVLEFAKFEQYDQATKISNILRDGVYNSAPVTLGIMLVGDSTMWGSIPGDTLNQDPKHPGVALKQAIDLIYPGNLATVSNNAIPATTLKQMLAGTDGGVGTYADRLAAAPNTTIVFCNHCLNDCGSYQSDLAEYRDNLVIFVNTTRSYSKIPVLVTPSLICPIGGGREDQMKRQPAFIQAMLDVARVMGVDLVDNFYFTERSSELYKPHDIAPDGVHLSQTFYQQAGWNMAIPLLQPHTLTDAGDVCGFATSQWADNITTARAMQYQQSSRFSTMLTGDASAAMQAVNYPVVLDRPTKDTVLAIGGRLIANGGVGQITYFGLDSQPQLDGIIDFNGGAVTNYDGVFLPRFCALPAGLSIVGVKISTGISPAPNVKFSFSGVTLLDKVDVSFGFGDNTGFQLSKPILTRNSVRNNMYISQGATILELRDVVSPFNPVITLKWDNALNKVVLLTPAGSTDVWASPAPGQINATLTLNDSRTVTATLGGLTATSPSIGKSAGVLFVGNNVMYSVR